MTVSMTVNQNVRIGDLAGLGAPRLGRRALGATIAGRHAIRLIRLAMVVLSLAILVGLAGLVGLPPRSALASDMSDCEGPDIARKLESCSRLIAIAKLPKAKLALVHNHRGMALVMTGETEAAIKDFDRAIALDANLADAYSNRGHAFIFVADFPAALRDFDKAIALRPDDDMFYTGRATAFLLTGRLKVAHRDLSKAIALNPKNAGAYMSRGTVNQLMGDALAAIADFKSVLKLTPNDEDARHAIDELIYGRPSSEGEASLTKPPTKPRPRIARRQGSTKLSVVWAK